MFPPGWAGWSEDNLSHTATHTHMWPISCGHIWSTTRTHSVYHYTDHFSLPGVISQPELANTFLVRCQLYLDLNQLTYPYNSTEREGRERERGKERERERGGQLKHQPPQSPQSKLPKEEVTLKLQLGRCNWNSTSHLAPLKCITSCSKNLALH